MVIIESIVASAVSGFILKQVAQAHIRKHSMDDENSKATEEGDESLSQETSNNAQEEDQASCGGNQVARAALIQDSEGHVRHAIVFEGPVELTSLSAIDLWDGPAEIMKVESR